MRNFKIFVLVFVGVVGAAVGRENVYTFSGEYTYKTVLSALALKTNRSVLGVSAALDLKRNFEIYKKPFFVAVDHVGKNLLSDGYILKTDSSSFTVLKIFDSLQVEKMSREEFTVYLPYSKRYLVTNSRQEYLNAKQIDYEKHVSDSLVKVMTDTSFSKYKWVYNYKCDLYLVGCSLDSEKYAGITFSNNLGLSVNPYPFDLTINTVNAGVGFNKVKDSLNFQRHLVFYISGDSGVNLVFGNDIREQESVITSATGAVTTSYRDTYDGLKIFANPRMYNLTYRIGTNEITLTGVRDSLIMGSSLFYEDTRNQSFYIFRNRQRDVTLFYLQSLLKCEKIDSLKVEKTIPQNNLWKMSDDETRLKMKESVSK